MRRRTSTPASVRQRRYRHRLRAGIGVACVPYDAAAVELLVRMQLLRESEAEDRKAIASAFEQLIADAAKRA